MTLSDTFSIGGFLVALLTGWVALSMRTVAAELRTEIEKIRSEHSEARRIDSEQTLRMVNGSYMRANEVRGIVERIETEIKAIAARITLMERN